MKAWLSILIFLTLWPPVVIVRAQTEKPPSPVPEVQRLGYYVGTWEGHGKTKGGPFGAAGNLSSKMTCDWFAGRFQVVCRGEETGPTGTRGFLNILSYDRKEKKYAEYSISSLGESEYDRGGSYIGNKLTFVLNENAGGKPAKFRYTEAHVSPRLYIYRAEVAVAGKPWSVLAEGKITKVR
jgi:hypothetical protein